MDVATTNSGESNSSPEVQLEENRTVSGINSMARYKLLSPAKLPISRSPCVTVPPGFSPTSFLESPVLLSNMKVEPSPTTGSFLQALHCSMASPGSATFSLTPACFNTGAANGRKSSFFEFKPNDRNMVPADFNNDVSVSEQSTQVQSFRSSPLNENEIEDQSNELSLPSPVRMISPGTCAPVDGNSSELNLKGNAANVPQSSNDGYNWRKYGQKHVKGSEFPRSYYKCTHPNCEVKKLFERSHDGQITEIIYKGTHDHPKPQPNNRYSAGSVMSTQGERSDIRVDKTSNSPEQSPVATNDLSLDGAGFASTRTNDEVDDDDPFSKRRKMELGNAEIIPIVKPIREPRVVVQTMSEVDILDDGYRWRKYGQKVVRGNPNPRSYYKCTNAGCPVRKHVERASHDPKAVITTYEGKHNHDVPAAKNSSHDMSRHAASIEMTRIKLEESDTISLNLGMGINSATENRSNGRRHMLLSEFGNSSQTHTSNSNFKFVHTTSVPVYYGVLNNSSNPLGSRENRNDGLPLNRSAYPCTQNMGRILMGP
ncbi:probable WRKY transcription factor 20 [Vicia villosa]|uniref:probable WRKY transcription factor 20 n=1 Tax=Vicia villosa TaxID=3911 RepID=UPI00273C78B1|nr:probable WRKY transcription factor 20 [Vicia villosa]